MKFRDLIWLGFFAALSFLALWPASLALLLETAAGHKYAFGFGAFAVMGLLGESVEARVESGRYLRGGALFLRAAAWGFYGIAAVFMFFFYNGAVIMAQGAGFLPGGGLGVSGSLMAAFFTSFFFATAFFASLFFNCTFNLLMMALRRLLGGAARARAEAAGQESGPFIARAAERTDWADFIRYDALRNIPLFWTPLYTIVFMFPPQYWSLLACWLGTILIALLAVSKPWSRFRGNTKAASPVFVAAETRRLPPAAEQAPGAWRH
ncbi:MAG: hypothetical protein LBS31_02440 [Candidatus Adiutrix sp.]|nr:hypothetical protein [Candidatus Adiutrix sp.]